MRFLLRVIAIMVAMYAALTMLRRLLTAFTPAGQVGKDPVCGTYVPQGAAIQAGNQFFCSEECRRKYKI
jgi:hypothetical protein